MLTQIENINFHSHPFSFAEIIKRANILIVCLFCRTPQGLEDVTGYPRLFAELLATRRWTEFDLKKLAGLNLLRVMREAEHVSPKMKLQD